MSTRRSAAIALFAISTGMQISAQARPTLARYRPSKDTLNYEIRSPFAIWWSRGADTVWGPSAGGWQLESHAWRGTATRPVVVIQSRPLDMPGDPTVDSFTLFTNGRVALKNGAPPTPDAWVDVFPLLPDAEVRRGMAWGDTVASIDTTVPGGRVYRNVRRHVVERIVDTLGTRRLELTTTGSVRIRLVIDSTAWIDVNGPATEHVVFDLGSGRLIRRASSMSLTGTGVAPTSVDTLPARFESSTNMELIKPASARLLLDLLQRKVPSP